MDKQCFVFCTTSVGICLLIAVLAFPYAAISSKKLENSRNAMSAEQFEDVDLGDFGTVSVLDMVSHYIDNPPAAPVGEIPKVRLQGC
jgi:triphosphoribosyl-dephospho-CoA synthetase